MCKGSCPCWRMVSWSRGRSYILYFTNNRKHCILSAPLAKMGKFTSHHRLLIQVSWCLQGVRGFIGIHPGILSTVHFALLIKWLLLCFLAFIAGTIWCGWLGDFHQRSCTEKWIHLGILWRGKLWACYVATLFWKLKKNKIKNELTQNAFFGNSAVSILVTFSLYLMTRGDGGSTRGLWWVSHT